MDLNIITILAMTLQGITPTFYKIPVTAELSEAIALSLYSEGAAPVAIHYEKLYCSIFACAQSQSSVVCQEWVLAVLEVRVVGVLALEVLVVGVLALEGS